MENPNSTVEENERQLTDEQLRELNAQKKTEHKTETDEAAERAGKDEDIQIDELGQLKEELIAKKKARLKDLKVGMKFTGFHQVRQARRDFFLELLLIIALWNYRLRKGSLP